MTQLNATDAKTFQSNTPKPFKYGVFLWHVDPRYRANEAIKLYHSETAANKYARERDLVVRDLAYCL